MSYLLQDFFRPDRNASNRALKKYLDQEGLALGFRDLVALRGAAESGVFFSFAFLESWAAGDFALPQVAGLLQRSEDPDVWCREHGWSWCRTPDRLLLVGLAGELRPEGPEEDDTDSREPAALVPLSAVYGSTSLQSAPGSGGVWNEDELQAASLMLLDGESEEKLVEAFRHLFRAAPHGAARAAVVATALARHRVELNREVADKLEEISPPLGQALRQLFNDPEQQGRQALTFLLSAEVASPVPPWVAFWLEIRAPVLESLARSEGGQKALREVLARLRQSCEDTGGNLLTHRLLEPLLGRPELLSPSDRRHLIVLLERFALSERGGLESLQSRLELAGDLQERILLGEVLRRIYLHTGRQAEWSALGQRFAGEALAVGATAGSLALAELLSSFGAAILRDSALTRIDSLSERQTLHVMAVWEHLAAHDQACLEAVGELYVLALREAECHWGLVLKSPLLQLAPVTQAFAGWYAEQSPEHRRKVVLVGQSWTLTVANRALVARLLGEQDWLGSELWEQEWKRTTLSFQRLGWLCQCLERRAPVLQPWCLARLAEWLDNPPRNLYFWDLVTRLARFPGLEPALRERIVRAARQLTLRLEAGLEDEKEAMLLAATAALSQSENPERVVEEWSRVLQSGTAEELAWTLALIRGVFRTPNSPFAPERTFISSLLQRLFQSGPDSMQLALRAALKTDTTDLALPAVLSLELQNLGLEALAAVASHPGCPPGIRRAVERRLVLFLCQWGQDLARTDDLYSFRSTPLFSLLEPWLTSADDDLQALFDEVASLFLGLQRRHPERLRLEVRQSAQRFFARWAAHREEQRCAEVVAWRRLLQELATAPER